MKSVLVLIVIQAVIYFTIIGCLIWASIAGYKYVKIHGLKKITEQIWNGTPSEKK